MKLSVSVYLIQISQAVKKVSGYQESHGKRCEAKVGGQEIAVMVD